MAKKFEEFFKLVEKYPFLYETPEYESAMKYGEKLLEVANKALKEGDVSAFKRVPGIGPKSAKRILVEIGEFTLSGEVTQSVQEIAHEKATLALESLGFKKEAIKKALKSCKSSTTEELIKEALKLLR